MFAWNTRVACHDRDVVYSQVACSWKLQCEMYVLQFYLNLFQRCTCTTKVDVALPCIDASTSTPPHLSTFTSSHAHIRRSTSPPHHITSVHPLQIYITPAHPHCHSFTSTLSFSLSIHLFDSAGQLHVSLSGQPSSSSTFFRLMNVKLPWFAAFLVCFLHMSEQRKPFFASVKRQKQQGERVREGISESTASVRSVIGCPRLLWEPVSQSLLLGFEDDAVRPPRRGGLAKGPY